MERKVLWNRPEKNKRGEPLYTSKCGRYRIEKCHMSNLSGRNGYFTKIEYRLTVLATGATDTLDKLGEAKDMAEMDNDPNWEPS